MLINVLLGSRAMSVLDLLLTFQFNTRLESFIAKFKTAETSTAAKKSKLHSVLSPLLTDDFDPFDQSKYVSVIRVVLNFKILPSHRKGLNQQKKALKELRAMFDTTAYFDSDGITSILMVMQNSGMMRIKYLEISFVLFRRTCQTTSTTRWSTSH
jgi:inositol 1,4,5-triphosphate receptor type 1